MFMETKVYDDIVNDIAEAVAKFASPSKIIEYSTKHDLQGNVTAFKLCVIGSTVDQNTLLRKVYDEIDSAIPFDLIFYTEEQFEALKQDSEAFANRVSKGGRLRYGS